MGSGDAHWGRCTRRAHPNPTPWSHRAPCGDLCLLHALRTMEYTSKMLFLLSAQMLVMLTHSLCVLKVWDWDVNSSALQHYHLFVSDDRRVVLLPFRGNPPPCLYSRCLPSAPCLLSLSHWSHHLISILQIRQGFQIELASDLATTAHFGLSTHQKNIPFLLHILKLPPTPSRKELWGIHGPAGSSGT